MLVGKLRVLLLSDQVINTDIRAGASDAQDIFPRNIRQVCTIFRLDILHVRKSPHTYVCKCSQTLRTCEAQNPSISDMCCHKLAYRNLFHALTVMSIIHLPAIPTAPCDIQSYIWRYPHAKDWWNVVSQFISWKSLNLKSKLSRRDWIMEVYIEKLAPEIWPAISWQDAKCSMLLLCKPAISRFNLLRKASICEYDWPIFWFCPWRLTFNWFMQLFLNEVRAGAVPSYSVCNVMDY